MQLNNDYYQDNFDNFKQAAKDGDRPRVLGLLNNAPNSETKNRLLMGEDCAAFRDAAYEGYVEIVEDLLVAATPIARNRMLLQSDCEAFREGGFQGNANLERALFNYSSDDIKEQMLRAQNFKALRWASIFPHLESMRELLATAIRLEGDIYSELSNCLPGNNRFNAVKAKVELEYFRELAVPLEALEDEADMPTEIAITTLGYGAIHRERLGGDYAQVRDAALVAEHNQTKYCGISASLWLKSLSIGTLALGLVLLSTGSAELIASESNTSLDLGLMLGGGIAIGLSSLGLYRTQTVAAFERSAEEQYLLPH